MTRKIGDKLIIESTPDAVCELCGKTSELRPYGPNNENICFECGMKNLETTKEKFLELMHGPGERIH